MSATTRFCRERKSDLARSKKAKEPANTSAEDGAQIATDAVEEAVQDAPTEFVDAAIEEATPEKIEDAEIVDPRETSDPEPDETPETDDLLVDASDGTSPEPTEPDTTLMPEVAPPTPEPAERPSVFFPMLVGGLVAAGLGFGAAKYTETTEAPVTGPSETEIALQAALDTQSESLDTQTAQIASLTTQIEALTADNAEKADALQALQDQIANLPEPAPVVAPTGGEVILNEEVAAALAAQKDQIAALSAELEAMTATAKAQMDAAAAEVENIALQEEHAKARTAVSTIRAALETGAPFAELLPEISNVTEVPAALQEVAETGVPTLAALQNGFGTAARDALSASRRAEAGDTTTDRMKLFFQDQLGTRSLVPREGDGPDAVLSRIEAAVKTGDLSAIAPLADILPEAGQAALADWRASVDTRQSAATAVQSLSDTLAAN